MCWSGYLTALRRSTLPHRRTGGRNLPLLRRMSWGGSDRMYWVARICQLPQEEVCWHCLSTDWVRQGYVASGESARTCGRCCDGSSGSSGLRGRNVSIMEENGPLGCGCGILGGFAPACTSPWFSLCETTGRAGRTLLGQCARGRVRKLR